MSDNYGLGVVGTAVWTYSRHRPTGATIPPDPGTVTISRLRHGGSAVLLASATDGVGVAATVGIGVAVVLGVLLFTVGAESQAQRHIASKAADKNMGIRIRILWASFQVHSTLNTELAQLSKKECGSYDASVSYGVVYDISSKPPSTIEWE